jgi:hypothetical protein
MRMIENRFQSLDTEDSWAGTSPSMFPFTCAFEAWENICIQVARSGGTTGTQLRPGGWHTSGELKGVATQVRKISYCESRRDGTGREINAQSRALGAPPSGLGRGKKY